MSIAQRILILLSILIITILSVHRLIAKDRFDPTWSCPCPIGVYQQGKRKIFCFKQSPMPIDQVMNETNISLPGYFAASWIYAGQQISISTNSSSSVVKITLLPALTRFLLNIPLELNQLTEQELQILPRIGPALAKRIVNYREENGPFTTIDELAQVKGIGRKTLERLKPHLRVEQPMP